jgi:hypothetical protein
VHLEITPDPTEEERRAIVEALQEETEASQLSPWQKEALASADDDYATAPLRQRRGATRT